MNMTSDLLVSVIIPAYNIDTFIEECIESVRCQTYKAIQIIIIDDGSTDDTGKICDGLAEKDKRIQVIHQKRGGVVAARQAGMTVATGYYTSFVDGDDWIQEDMLAYMIHNIEDSDLISTGLEREVKSGYFVKRTDDYSEGRYQGTEIDHILENAIYDENTRYVQKLTPWLVNKLFVTEKLRDIILNEDTHLCYGEDTVALYQYLRHCDSIYISKQTFYHYRFRIDSTIHHSDNRATEKLSWTYNALLDVLQLYPIEFRLIYQLQKWYVISVLEAINERMGFDKRVRVSRFIADTDGLNLADKKIVIYAAGRVGQDYYNQFFERKYNVVLWVDKNSGGYAGEVKPVSTVLGSSYDIILIAVERKNLADAIREELADMGIPEEKIIWRRPFYSY